MICHVLKFPEDGLGACTSIIPKERYKRYQKIHDQKHEQKWGKRGMDELMTALINQQDAASAMLANSHKKQERPTPIDLPVSSSQGGLQMSIDVVIEKGTTMDI